eukprot:scaffold15391_cov146-Isochrysis_galbana.AAC.3
MQLAGGGWAPRVSSPQERHEGVGHDVEHRLPDVRQEGWRAVRPGVGERLGAAIDSRAQIPEGRGRWGAD